VKARRLACFVLAALVVGLPTASPAFADDAPPLTSPAQLSQRTANFAWDKTLLRASFSYSDVLTPLLRTKLSNGLSNVIVMRAYVFEAASTSPVALAAKTCNVSYDVWDEVYRIKLTTPDGTLNKAVVNVDGVVRECAAAQDLPIADRSLMKAGASHFLAVIADVNPVSEEMLAQLQKWVERPMGSTAIAPGNALFGAFVGLFVKNIGSSDRSIQFRTQAFVP
jgi:hypothetical protein